MGKRSCVQVANGFLNDVYVKTDVIIVSSRSESSDNSFSLETTIPLLEGFGISFEMATSIMKQVDYHVLHQAGFSKLPKGEVTTFSPPSDASDSNSVFLTMVYFTDEGTLIVLHDNKPVEKNSSWVITKEGGLTGSKPTDPFVSVVGNENHTPQWCSDCPQGEICSNCFPEAEICKLQSSIKTIQSCHLGSLLLTLSVELEQDKKWCKTSKGELMLREIKELAIQYSILESKTKVIVRDIQTYGENLKEAAEDFALDGIISDFFDKVRDLDDVETSLKDVNEKHTEIKTKVEIIQRRAEKYAETFGQKKKKADDAMGNLNFEGFTSNYHSFALMSSIPVLGTLGSASVIFFLGAEAGVCIISKGLPKFCKIPLQCTIGGVGGILGCATGVVFSAVHLPAAPFLWAHYIYKNGSRSAYDALQKQFSDIAIQMIIVEEHIAKIESCLSNIRTKLKQGSRAERDLVIKLKGTEEEKKKLLAGRAAKTGEDLTKDCEHFFELAKMREKKRRKTSDMLAIEETREE